MVTIALALALATAQPIQASSQIREAERLVEAGDTAGAVGAYTRALSESRRDTPEAAHILLAVAKLQAGLGRHADAVRDARAAFAIWEAAHDLGGMSEARNAEGLSHLYAGDYRAADSALRAALGLSKKAGIAELQAEQLGNLGNVHYFLGRYTDARGFYEEALARTSAHQADAWAARRYRILVINQATLFQRLGQDREALAIYRTFETDPGSLRPREQAQLLANQGVLYRRLGDPIKALEYYDRARLLFARERNVDGELGVLKNRGIVLALDLGRLHEAEQTFAEALETAARVGNRREMLHAHLYRGETILKQGDRPRAERDFSDALRLAGELRTPEEEWKALYGLGRVTPGSSSATQNLSRAVDTVEKIREAIRVPALRTDFLSDKREVYDALLAQRVRDSPVADVFSLLERSHSRGWRERLNLTGSVDLTHVQAALPHGVLLLDYWNSPAGSAVVAITRKRSGVFPLSVNEQQITSLLDTLAAAPAGAWLPLREALSTLLPPAEWFDDVAHVVVVPDGSVSLIPFELLTVNGVALVNRAAVSYTPTAATLLRAPPSPDSWRVPWAQEMRAFADPVFGSSPLDDETPVRERLAGTRKEVHAVAAELAGRAQIYVAGENTKARLFEASNAPILHLATHAAADTSVMEQSRILFSPPEKQAGADYLFVREAYELPLTNVELAVLSACETERGSSVRGEGVQNFSRAFMAAGARSTVTTLWRVPDEPTAELMRVFYHYLQQGLPRDQALQQAKVAFLDSKTSLAHPHYWAAFVLTGDALRPIPRAVPWKFAVLPFAVVIAGIVLVTRRPRARA